jgi:spermidine/putrescine-binding protein
MRELYKWLNKDISVVGDLLNVPNNRENEFRGFQASHKFFNHRWKENSVEARLIEVNQFWVTFLVDDESQEKISEPMKKLTLSFDNDNERLMVIVDY